MTEDPEDLILFEYSPEDRQKATQSGYTPDNGSSVAAYVAKRMEIAQRIYAGDWDTLPGSEQYVRQRYGRERTYDEHPLSVMNQNLLKRLIEEYCM